MYFFADGLVGVEYFLCFFVGKSEQGGGREVFPYGDGSLRADFCNEFVVGEGYDGDPAVGGDFEALPDVSELYDEQVVATEFVLGEVEPHVYGAFQTEHRHGEFYLEGVGGCDEGGCRGVGGEVCGGFCAVEIVCQYELVVVDAGVFVSGYHHQIECAEGAGVSHGRVVFFLQIYLFGQ